jgi:Ser/Thr protein kinase RdoA (MazF antagonist)
MGPTWHDDLTAVLARYPAIVRPSRPPEPLGNAGGASGARLWRYESGRGPMVARAWPHDGPGRGPLEQIHRWLSEAAGVGFIPVPMAALDGRTLQERGGRLWDVSPWLEGTAIVDRPPTRPRLRSGFAALAAFHQALKSGRAVGPSPGLVMRLRETEALIRVGFDSLERALNGNPADPRREPARRWLALARAVAPRLIEPMRRASGCKLALQPCLRDARPDHLLFVGDRVTGLVDFGAMAIETVAADLARLLGEWVGPDRIDRSEALAAYASIRPLDADELALIEVFEDSAALLGAGHWVRWHFLEARPFEDPSAVADGISRGLERLARRAAADGGMRLHTDLRP